MSLYVKVYNSFYTHRKTARLSAAIGDAAFWVPPRLWAYAAHNQPDGCFKDYTAQEIANLIGYAKDAASMLEALLRAGFLDSDPLRIHDWAEHNSYHKSFADRAAIAAKARWEKEKEMKGKDIEKIGDKHCLEHATSIPEAGGSELPLGAEAARPSKAKAESEADCVEFAKSLGLPDRDGSFFWHKCVGNGWKNGGTAIRDWKATMRAWNAAGYMPSQKAGGKATRPESRQMEELIEVRSL